MIKKTFILFATIILLFFIFRENIYKSNNILIASSMPLTGPMEPWGKAVLEATKSYFAYTNENNLLNEKRVEFLALDDKYEPDLTYENLKNIKSKDVFALFGLVGTPTIKRVLPEIYDDDILLFSPFSGASFLQDERLSSLINFRASYKQELEKIIFYLKNKNLNKIAIFYQNDDYGEEGYISSLEILKKENLNLVAVGSYKRNTLAIVHAFNEIKQAKPDAILMIGAHGANSYFIQKAKKDIDFENTLFCNISFSDANSIIDDLKATNTDTKNIIFSQVVPNYNDLNLKIVQEYQEIMKKYSSNSKLGFLSFESFLATKVLINAIKTSNNNLSKKNFIEALKKTPKDLLYEIEIDYKDKKLLNKTYIFEYENSNFKEIR